MRINITSAEFDPYRIPAGPELDLLVNEMVFGVKPDSSAPPFSTDDTLIDRLKDKLSQRFTKPIVLGKLRATPVRYFARYESGASTATEVLAPSRALAISRLALLLTAKY